MDTQNCEKCGLLHDPEDGDCLGCEMGIEIQDLKNKVEDLKGYLNCDYPHKYIKNFSTCKKCGFTREAVK